MSRGFCLCQSIFFFFSAWFLFLKNFSPIGHFFFSSVYFIALPLPFDVNWPRLSKCFLWSCHSTNYYNKGVKVLVAQSCLTLCDSMDCSSRLLCPQDSPGKNTEVDCIPLSRVSSRPRDQIQVSHIAGRFFTSWAIREAKWSVNSHIIIIVLVFF